MLVEKCSLLHNFLAIFFYLLSDSATTKRYTSAGHFRDSTPFGKFKGNLRLSFLPYLENWNPRPSAHPTVGSGTAARKRSAEEKHFAESEVPESVRAFEALVVPGVGENGAGVSEGNRQETDAIMKKYAFNKVASDQISLKRGLPDVRHQVRTKKEKRTAGNNNQEIKCPREA